MERSGEPVPVVWRDFLKSFPRGCCELASQTLVQYLKDHDDHVFPYVIAMQWNDNQTLHGHVMVALDGEYIDLTLDQFDGYDDYIVAEPIESSGQLGTFIQHVRHQDGAITTRKLTFDGIPDDNKKLYAWLKDTADSLLVAAEQESIPCRLLSPLSMDIPPEYRDKTVTGPSDKKFSP